MPTDRPYAKQDDERIRQMRDAVTDPIPISPSSALGRRRKRLIEVKPPRPRLNRTIMIQLE